MPQSAPDLIRAPSHGDRAEAQPYDFARPRSVSDRLLVVAEAAHAAFADGLATTLSDALGESVIVRSSTLDDVAGLDFVNSRARPTAFFGLGLGAVGPRLGLDLAPALALFLVERHLGGSDALSAEGRALSGLERAVVEDVWMPRFASVFAETWGTIPPTAQGFAPAPEAIDLVPPSDRVVSIDFEVSVGDASATLSLAYPVDTLRVLLEVATSAPTAEAAPAPPVRTRVLGTVPVDLRAELGRTRLSVSDLLGLAPGDVIPLAQPADAPIAVSVGDGLRFEAHTGISGTRLALRVLTPPTAPTPS